MDEINELKFLIQGKINLYKAKIAAEEWGGGYGPHITRHSLPMKELEWVLECLEKIGDTNV